MITAQEATKITETHRLEMVLREIQTAAQKGEDFIVSYLNLSEAEVSQMVGLGYQVTYSSGFIISWQTPENTAYINRLIEENRVQFLRQLEGDQ